MDNTIKLSSSFKDMTYDKHFKNVFRIKRILAIVIKETIDIYALCQVDDIVGLIGEIKVDSVQAGSEKIESSESFVDNGAGIKYDILVTVQLPKDLQKISTYKFIQIKLDLEMQRDFYPGYVLSKRGLYYASRMVSDQLSVISRDTSYDKLMPVYSIWITLVEGKSLANKVLKYQLKNTSTSTIDDNAKPVIRMDAVTSMFNIIFVCIDKNVLFENKVSDGLESIVEFLSLMFTGNFEDSRLKERHDVMFSSVLKEHEKEMREMAGYLTELEREKAESADAGMKQGMEQGMKQGMKLGEILGTVGILFDIGWSLDKIFNKIKEKYNLTDAKAEEYLSLYNERNKQI